MKEILGGDLELAFETLGVKAIKTFDGGEYQVWQLEDEEFEKLSLTDEWLWDSNWGWWRQSDGSNIGQVNKRFSINGHWINAWSGDDLFNKYDNLIEYYNSELNLSSERNICALAVELANQNGLTLGELFTKYQLTK